MNTDRSKEKKAAKLRDEWTQTVQDLEREISDWAKAEGWNVHASEKVVSEESIGTYIVPDLIIETPEGERLILEVKGRGPANSSGRVQLSAWPTLFRVLLLHKSDNDSWIIRTDSGIPLRSTWNRETFITLAKDLLSAE
ncbi:MAG TPA: hypothetical protein VKA70_22415 [Blastocatellia bacterium]|nr:hypothetical protein [Blastocatellia bacterium]